MDIVRKNDGFDLNREASFQRSRSSSVWSATFAAVALAAHHTRELLEAGCDEAGRGCLAGPVVAAAVILPPRVRLPGLDDSKKLNAEQRSALRILIEERALAWSVALCTPREIDEVNILNASFLAMHRAIAALKLQPQQLLIDGNRFNPYPGIPHVCIVEGDGRFRNIAAASILAKTHRDAMMVELHEQHPHYNWIGNKGYPTIDHRNTLDLIGPTIHHRQSFRLKYWEDHEKAAPIHTG